MSGQDRRLRRIGVEISAARVIGVGTLLWCLGPFAALPVPAQDAPHSSSTQITVGCTTPCHLPHHAVGSGLTSSASNVNLCQSCHNPSGLAGDLPINSADSAVPGVQGTSHAFDVAAINGALEVQEPLSTEMLLRVMDGDVVCSTCHNPHQAGVFVAGSALGAGGWTPTSQRQSLPLRGLGEDYCRACHPQE